MGGSGNAYRWALAALGNQTRPAPLRLLKSTQQRAGICSILPLLRRGEDHNILDATSNKTLSVLPLIGYRLSSTHNFSSSSTQGEEIPKAKYIKKILIANRGEIACRVIKTAKKLGVRTVAVYSEGDRHAKHVTMADEAVFIGPALASASYLDGSKILATALATGADAIHPGYGFLSESSKFAELCKQKGVIFIGPPADAIRAMGDKSVAKSLMSAAGVPVVPGYHGEDQNPELLQAEANRISYPVLIKATQGGGGKGMRIVHNEADFLESLASAQRESQAAFGDSRVLIEKYISRPRHIEVQIFADKHGNAVHLNERDCSVQRRHQKIIEEAPAPNITPEFRQRIGQAAVDAAKAVGYVSAGTVEFIVDTISGDFYFMEMNTRLQVEHPVTEMVTGQDLVEWQIRVADGEALPLQQSEVKLMGHSFEARIYAENVPKGFLPAAGRLQHYSPPSASPTVRVETGVGEGDNVSVFYDPMIAKLVVWGRDRSAALTKLIDSLTKFQIAGLPTNIGFLKTLASHHAFAAGDVDTHFIDRFKTDLLPVTQSDSIHEPSLPKATQYGAALAAAASVIKSRQERPDGLNSIWSSGSGFRLNHLYTRMLHLDWRPESGDSTPLPVNLKLTYEKLGNILVEGDKVGKIAVTGKQLPGDGSNLRLNVEEKSVPVSLAQFSQGNTSHIHLWEGDHHHHFSVPVPVHDTDESQEHKKSSHGRHERHPAQGPGAVIAPMAGRVVKIFAANGTRVKKGDSILVLEAMKMEHVVKAPMEGVVKGAELEIGQQVTDSTVLFQIEVPVA
ncbi:methylcrotonoyl-CoA carboxylase subunit alpha, mitochondrial [Physcomitrium patens]|uniref:Uncharacterized protein n=1 Tax=Physcomitrium patens TaxID=3218 RepID=A0A2K1J0L5_PHYPA|nr:methylcrotonoyl-CoA carboxylase subunit alpha, mitochondrial-like [Physcomitrium patens]XP_024402895.1 methylcrotonoyl-CoA carboxylase subunit alpha, mitochondrial-like [Physcomitrium patens]XP_024402896.1 methylcrotonoyl-CoA carboxylase subunit alpha, mitochondrial-like [Physcomitrium patens]XP_024402897.1 methylcrotonoyl-CoA carboxylase subunit alpha, mitochondrial-like [Physcomitrium patens]PNR35064.1 hypothetical protein PHYPA_022963 [Physcomitrium patens]|eukprot:XP_024402894.1 methylcrotonoyl-CoA carboxylase subunit alpha, mitochondrial-like [Physcomitrella patens]